MIAPVLPVYGRSPLCFTHGQGVYLYTDNNEKYLDFVSGIAVNALGHNHPHMVKTLKNQAEKVWHLSNLYDIPGMQSFAERLAAASFADTMFFCNSGTEAIETGLKMVRKYHDDTGNPNRFRVITFEGAFHGRSLSAISATKKPKCLAGFEPEVDGFDLVPFGDIEAVKAAITDDTGAILIEPIQGEGGIRQTPKGFLQALRDICDEHGLLLFLDEIQCGMGRTGKLFAHELDGVTPDILASAKGIGAGFPLGACLATEKVGRTMHPGSHGSTYGGNPLAMAVGNAVLDIILDDGFLENVTKSGHYLTQSLQALQKKYPHVIEEIRGTGLIQGIKTTSDSQTVIAALRDDQHMLTVGAADNVIRILPPLIVEESHIDDAINRLSAVFDSL